MGWLGWRPHETDTADVNDVLLALEGKIDLLAMMGYVKRLERGTKADFGRDWQAFKKRHNLRHQYAQQERERGGG